MTSSFLEILFAAKDFKIFSPIFRRHINRKSKKNQSLSLCRLAVRESQKQCVIGLIQTKCLKPYSDKWRFGGDIGNIDTG